MKRLFQFLTKICMVIIPLLILLLTVKGDKGNPIAYQKEKATNVGGPYEASNSTSRYALTEAIVENHSLSFTNQQAKFASPDLVYYKKRFYTIFTPGVSLIGIPFYFFGRFLSMPQLFTFFSITLIALANMFLITSISRSLGANKYTAYIGGLIFLFATNALTYANTYTQHHVTTLLILLALRNAIGERTIVKNVLFGCILGFAILVDIPNIILLFPIASYIVIKHFSLEKVRQSFLITCRTSILTIVIGVLPFMSLFAWYNKTTTGSLLKTGQTIGRTDYQQVFGKKQTSTSTIASGAKDKKSLFPFQSRLQVQGMNVLLLSNERAWLYYSPVILFGILGFIILYNKKRNVTFINVLLSLVGVNIILYSMFGDPWGGWAFGPRYLIPSAAILAVMTSIAIQRFYKNVIFTLFFFVSFVYSVFVNVLGVVTTAAIPPKQEAMSLMKPIPYTYEYNLQLVDDNMVSSLIYNLFLKNSWSAYSYVFLIAACIILTSITMYAFHVLYERRRT